jgi:PKD repeat protein
MKTFTKTIIAASIAIITNSVYAENHITQLDQAGNIKKDFVLSQPAGQVDVEKNSTTGTTIESQMYSGQEAIDFLGNDFDKVATEHNYEPASLRKTFLSDPTLKVDKDGKLVFIDEIPASFSQATPKTVEFNGDATKLHSNPGASKILYINLDGFDTAGTAWEVTGIGVLKPWVTSQNNIYQLWSIIAEDYSPFNVDVTTEKPAADAMLRSSTDDQNYGVEITVTGTSPVGTVCGGCGGIAYVGTVNAIIAPPQTINRYQPVLVFPSMLGYSPSAVAVASSHEAGHALGLIHDGLNNLPYHPGSNGWGPIMGAPYGASITQWSKGEYAGANNFEDDILIISRNFPVRTDNVTNTFDNVPTLETDKLHSSTAIIREVNGLIETETDKDVFSFTTPGGDVVFSVSPATVKSDLIYYGSEFYNAPNLKPKATLYDENKNVVATSNEQSDPLFHNKVNVTSSLTSGKYFIVIEGDSELHNGTTVFTKYGSIGQYTLTGSYVSNEIAPPPTAVVGASVTEGTGPLVVSFNSDGSAVGYGSSLQYTWSYDDGSVDTYNPTDTHTFKSSGNHLVTLTVTNDADLVSKATISVNVRAPLINIAKIKKLALKLAYAKKYNTTSGTVTVTVVNEKNKGVPASTVCGHFDGSFTTYKGALKEIQVCGLTNKSGVATIKTGSMIIYGKSGTMSFTIDKVESSTNPSLVFDKSSGINTTVMITK